MRLYLKLLVCNTDVLLVASDLKHPAVARAGVRLFLSLTTGSVYDESVPEILVKSNSYD